jgi:4-aminobutyrate aminotransferase-like enzyme
LWLIEVPAGVDVGAVVHKVCERGIVVIYTGSYIRILPSVTVKLNRLAHALKVLAEELAEACGAASD